MRNAEVEDRTDLINVPGFETEADFNYFYITDLQWEARIELEKEKDFYNWHGMGEAIPALAAFGSEGAHQEMHYSQAYTPYAILTRKDIEAKFNLRKAEGNSLLNGG